MRYFIFLLLFVTACTSKSDKNTETVRDLLELYKHYNYFERLEEGKVIKIKDVCKVDSQKSFLWKRIKWILNEQNLPEKVSMEIVETEFHKLMTLGSKIEQDEDGGWIYFFSKEYQQNLSVVDIQLELVSPSSFDQNSFELFINSFTDPDQIFMIPENKYLPDEGLRLMFKIPDAFKITTGNMSPFQMECRIGILNNNSDDPRQVTNELFSLFKTLITMNNTDNIAQ